MVDMEDSNGEISAYEARRLANIRANQQVLDGLFGAEHLELKAKIADASKAKHAKINGVSMCKAGSMGNPLSVQNSRAYPAGRDTHSY